MSETFYIANGAGFYCGSVTTVGINKWLIKMQVTQPKSDGSNYTIDDYQSTHQYLALTTIAPSDPSKISLYTWSDNTWVECKPYILPLTTAGILAKRRAAYATESDHLKTEADYNAFQTGRAPDYSQWEAAVKAIKARFPKPVKAT